MAGYTDPNTTLAPGKSLAFNKAALISPAQVGPTKQHTHYETGPIQQALPRQRQVVTPTSFGETTGPALGRG